MSILQLLQGMAERVATSASVKNVYDEPRVVGMACACHPGRSGSVWSTTLNGIGSAYVRQNPEIRNADFGLEATAQTCQPTRMAK